MRNFILVIVTACIVLCVEISGHAALQQPQRFRKIRPQASPLIKSTTLQTVATTEVALFNSENLDGWSTVSGSKDIKAWEAVDGTLHRKAGGGDIVTEKEYGNFILDFEWKISSGGNSGLKYKFSRLDNQWLGYEYQILDNENHSDGKLKTHQTAALYDIIAPKVDAAKPIGEYNHSRIIVNGRRIQHWLNGRLVVDVVVGSQQWEDGFLKSKFKDHELFGKIPQGKILLQDHGDEVWFKNIVLRELKTVAVKKAGPFKRLRTLRRLR